MPHKINTTPEEFVETFTKVVGEFGTKGTNLPEKELNSWLDGSEWKRLQAEKAAAEAAEKKRLEEEKAAAEAAAAAAAVAAASDDESTRDGDFA